MQPDRALPDLDDDEALGVWLDALAEGGAARIDQVLDALDAAFEIEAPAAPDARTAWRDRLRTVLVALEPIARDPRVSRMVLAAIGSSSSDDWFHSDEVVHVAGHIAPTEDPSAREPSLGSVFLTLLSRADDPLVLDWIAIARGSLREVDCNGAAMRDALDELTTILETRFANTRGTATRSIADAGLRGAERLHDAVSRRLKGGVVVDLPPWRLARMRPGVMLSPPLGRDLLAWPGWREVTAIELDGFVDPRTFANPAFAALRALFGLRELDATELLFMRPAPEIAVLGVHAPSIGHAGERRVCERAPEPPGEPAENESLSSAIVRGLSLPNLCELRLSLADDGRAESAARAHVPTVDRLRWLWRAPFVRATREIVLAGHDAQQVSAFWQSHAELPRTLRVLSFTEGDPALASPSGYRVSFARDDDGPFTRVEVREDTTRACPAWVIAARALASG